MQKGRNYYETLGISRDADNNEIRKAFRQKAKEYHPDSNTQGNPEAFRQAQEAYETLSNERSRRAYDQELHSGSGTGTAGAGPRYRPGNADDISRAFADLWDLFFAASSGSDTPREARYREPREREPIDYTVYVTSEEARDGTTVTLPHEGRRPLVTNIPPGVYHGQVITAEFRDLFGRREIRLHIDIRD